MPDPSPASPLDPINVKSLEVEIDNSLADEGYGLYHASSCATCHGSDAHSVGAAAPDLRESPTLLSYPVFRSIVVEGALLEKSMPLFDDLTEREVKAIFEYLLKQTLETQNRLEEAHRLSITQKAPRSGHKDPMPFEHQGH